MKVLFVTRSVNRAGYYRCVLPAMYGGYDWAAIDGGPPGLSLIAAWIDQANKEPDLLSYDVIIFQQVRGRKWADLIKKLRSQGVVVLYEIDDYVHGIRKLIDHDFSRYYEEYHLKAMEECMRACDGMIASTQFIADKYTRVMRDRPIWVCENGLDMGRYRLTKPAKGTMAGREAVTILWSGATGHQVAAVPWLEIVAHVMHTVPYTTFVSVGNNFAEAFERDFPDRTVGVPFTALECYPASMMLGDVAIAPAGTTDWYKAKSTLRAMEAAALGIPIVAAPHYASAVIEGETGYIAPTLSKVQTDLLRLVRDDDLRAEMSAKAKQHAIDNFAMQHRVEQWHAALAEAAALRA